MSNTAKLSSELVPFHYKQKTMATKRVGILTEFNYEDLEVRKRFMYVNVMSHLCFYRIHMRTTTFSNI